MTMIAEIGRAILAQLGIKFLPVSARAVSTYPEEVLEKHHGANSRRGRFGSRGYCLATGKDEKGRTRVMVHDSSRWVPHIGAKEMARHRNKPDGLMHTPVGGSI